MQVGMYVNDWSDKNKKTSVFAELSNMTPESKHEGGDVDYRQSQQTEEMDSVLGEESSQCIKSESNAMRVIMKPNKCKKKKRDGL